MKRKPIFVFQDGYIILNTSFCWSESIEDFLITIAEPVARTNVIHEYVLTPYALYAGVTSGLKSSEIIRILKSLSQNLIPSLIKKMIKTCSKLFGKLHLILHSGEYLIFSLNSNLLKLLIVNTEKTTNLFSVLILWKLVYHFSNQENKTDQFFFKWKSNYKMNLENFPKPNRLKFVLLLNSKSEILETMRRISVKIESPLLEEYDFSNEKATNNIEIELKSSSIIRNYQNKALSKMFNKGRARSGVIVLPCGSGKTIVGIATVVILKKISLVVCNSTVSVEQWVKQFLSWSIISPNKVRSFIAGKYTTEKTAYPDIVITTYSMISFGGQRARLSASLLGEIKQREWGLVIFDEVHIVPANVFRKVLGLIKTHCKLGLTATLLREDRKVGDIGFLIGPKLFEANWLELEKSGFLAMATCIEICCRMPGNFYDYYLSQNGQLRQILCALNPSKARTCDFLIRYHESKGDRVLVFSDNVFALRSYSTKLTKPFIYGATGSTERLKILRNFQEKTGQTLFISRIGDTSIDLPEANVIIQISSHFGSRRQEAQRLGRILRPKTRTSRAFFYSLVSSNTDEVFYSNKRQQFLISQGYDFRTVTKIKKIETTKNLIFEKENQRKDLLTQIVSNFVKI